MVSRRLFASWLFALTLLWGQAMASAHALSHAQERDPDAMDTVCEICVAHASLSAAANPDIALVSVVTRASCMCDSPDIPLPAAARLAACARAPPIHSV